VFPEKNEADDNDKDSEKEHEDRDPVDPVHVAHPFTMRGIGITLFDIQIFCNLSPDSHMV